MDLAQLELDPTKLAQGVIVRPWNDETEFILAFGGSGNMDAAALRVELERDMRLQLSPNGTSKKLVEATDEITCRLLAGAIIRGWNHLLLHGEEVPYSPEKALDLVRRIPLLRDRLWAACLAIEPYRADHDEGARKNS